jgi:hypothetical protein
MTCRDVRPHELVWAHAANVVPPGRKAQIAAFAGNTGTQNRWRRPGDLNAGNGNPNQIRHAGWIRECADAGQLGPSGEIHGLVSYARGPALRLGLRSCLLGAGGGLA